MQENGEAIVVRDPETPFLRESYPMLEVMIANSALAPLLGAIHALRSAMLDASSRFWPPLLEPMLPSLRSRSRRRSE